MQEKENALGKALYELVQVVLEIQSQEEKEGE